MSERDPSQVVRGYLIELKSALTTVPREIAKEIEDGVAEELAGLNVQDALTRIEELGDPAFIAAEAKESLRLETLIAPGVPIHQESGSTDAKQITVTTDPRWYIVVVSLLVALGGIVIPVLGWIAGIVMVWLSNSWHSWEKWVGTLAASVLTLLIVIMPYWLFARPGAVGAAHGEAASPLLPAVPELLWNGILFFTAVNMVVGLWLLVRALRRRVEP